MNWRGLELEGDSEAVDSYSVKLFIFLSSYSLPVQPVFLKVSFSSWFDLLTSVLVKIKVQQSHKQKFPLGSQFSMSLHLLLLPSDSHLISKMCTKRIMRIPLEFSSVI